MNSNNHEQIDKLIDSILEKETLIYTKAEFHQLQATFKKKVNALQNPDDRHFYKAVVTELLFKLNRALETVDSIYSNPLKLEIDELNDRISNDAKNSLLLCEEVDAIASKLISEGIL